MTPEQLLLVAREFCAQHKVTVTNFGALVAAASLSTAKMEGIAIHGNDAFATVCARVYMEIEDRLSLR